MVDTNILVRALIRVNKHERLRRVGGGWIFIHRMLMEHIVDLDDRFMASLDEQWRKMLEAT